MQSWSESQSGLRVKSWSKPLVSQVSFFDFPIPKPIVGEQGPTWWPTLVRVG